MFLIDLYPFSDGIDSVTPQCKYSNHVSELRKNVVQIKNFQSQLYHSKICIESDVIINQGERFPLRLPA